MSSVRLPFATQSYQARSLPLSAQQCINLFPEKAPTDAKTPVVLYGSPGLIPFATVGPGPIRLLYELAGTLYAVSKDSFYRINAAGSPTLLGTLAGPERTEHRLEAADNGRQLVIVNSGTGYGTVFNKDSDELTPITDVDFPKASSVTYVDGYHVFTRPNTGQFFISDILEATGYDALDFATAESYPDNLVRAYVDHRELWLFGSHSTEIWANVGAADFPFQRISGGVIEKGCGAAGSVARMDNSVYWLGNDRCVYTARGYQPVRVSTHALEYAFAKYDRVDDAFAYAHVMEGHSFYVLTFPSGPSTFVYDASTGQWHERRSRRASGQDLGRSRIGSYARCYEQDIVGDYSSNQLYRLDLDAHDEAGIPLARVAVSPVITAQGDRLFMGRVDIDVETGVGLTEGQGELPRAMLQWSDDGGRTWSQERWATLGRIGAYRHRARWYRLGTFRERYLRLSITDPVKVSILGASAELERGLP